MGRGANGVTQPEHVPSGMNGILESQGQQPLRKAGQVEAAPSRGRKERPKNGQY